MGIFVRRVMMVEMDERVLGLSPPLLGGVLGFLDRISKWKISEDILGMETTHFTVVV